MSSSIVPFVERLHIVTKDLGVARLGVCMNYAQREIVDYVDECMRDQRRCRLIILKARQIGCSTIIEGLMFTLAFLLPRMRGLVVSHEAESAQHLLNITRNYWDTWFMKSLYTPEHLASHRLGWKETGSRIRIATAKNASAGRSMTVQFLHGSEVAFWDDPQTLMTGLAQSIPHNYPSVIAHESTANGRGNWFHQRWNEAVEGESEYKPFFFPWHQHPEYTARNLGISSILNKLNDEERILRAIGVDDDRLSWRRWALRELCENDLERFHQEYPTTPEEAFISTGNNVFPDAELRAVYEPIAPIVGHLVVEGNKIRFQESSRGPLKIYRWPSDDLEWGRYMIAGDATRSVTGDFSCAQVLNRKTWEQVAVWRDKIDPVNFGDQMSLLGRYYNHAILCPEIQGAGDATISRLISLQYPFLFEHRRAEAIPGAPERTFGWWSTTRAKQEAIGNLLKAVIDRDITIHDAVTYAEMGSFVSLPSGRFGNVEGEGRGHDDTVTSLAICITCTMYEAMNVNASRGIYDGDVGGMVKGIAKDANQLIYGHTDEEVASW